MTYWVWIIIPSGCELTSMETKGELIVCSDGSRANTWFDDTWLTDCWLGDPK